MQANAKIDTVSTKKLNDVILSQKQFSDKSGLGYTGGSSSSGNVTKEVKFIKAKEQKLNLVLLLRSPRWRKRGMWMTNGC